MTTARATRADPAPIGWRGLFFVALGAVLVLLAYVRFDWYGVGQAAGTADAAPTATFDNLRASIDQFGGARAASVYFDWLGWTLLAAAIALGAVANLRTRFTEAARVLGFVVGAAGVIATYYALLQYADAQADAGAAQHNPLYNASWGLMCVLVGFLLTAVGAALGLRREDA